MHTDGDRERCTGSGKLLTARLHVTSTCCVTPCDCEGNWQVVGKVMITMSCHQDGLPLEDSIKPWLMSSLWMMHQIRERGQIHMLAHVQAPMQALAGAD